VLLKTAVIPRHEVPRTTSPTDADAAINPAFGKLAGLVLDMKVLAETPANELRPKLQPLLIAYGLDRATSGLLRRQQGDTGRLRRRSRRGGEKVPPFGSSARVPDPTTVLLAPHVHVTEDGMIHAETAEAARLIELLGLDSRSSQNSECCGWASLPWLSGSIHRFTSGSWVSRTTCQTSPV
jgi:hypothetical protein